MKKTQPVFRGTFEGMKLPDVGAGSLSNAGTQLAKPPRGPFKVEVFNRGDSAKPMWDAVLLPTRHPFKGRSFRTPGEARDQVATHFEKQIGEWRESDSANIGQTLLMEG